MQNEQNKIEKFIYDVIKKEFGVTKKNLIDFCKSHYELIGKGKNAMTLYKDIKTSQGFKIVYVSNPNFMQGSWNGGGKGVFAKLQYCGMVKTIRLIQE